MADLPQILADLRAQLYLVQRAIPLLEKIQRGPAKRPGRKSMSPEEREAVSARMKRYWADREEKKVEPPLNLEGL